MTNNGEITINQASMLLARQALAQAAGSEFRGKRNYYEEFGYKSTIEYKHYYSRFKRQDICSRIVEAKPNETWKKSPSVVDDPDKEEESSQFEKDFEDLAKSLELWGYLKRSDILSGIGRFGILLLGTADLERLDDFAEPLEQDSLNGPEDVLYLSPYGEGRVEIQEWDMNPGSENFGKPEFYEVDMAGDLSSGEKDRDLSEVRVHHSRVIHIAEGLLEDEVYGQPRLERVFNRLHDLVKVAGGSAEAFWQNANPGVAAKADPEYEMGPEMEEALEQEIEEYQHGFRRFMRLVGVDVKKLTTQIANPSHIFDVLIALISAATNIPKRILIGNEAGELASTQDENNWAAHIEQRQKNYANTVILRPLIDKLISAGVLSPPEDGVYDIEWEALQSMTEQEEADLNDKKASTLQKVAPAGEVDLITTREEQRELAGLPKEMPEEEDPLLDGIPLENEGDAGVQDQFEKMKK